MPLAFVSKAKVYYGHYATSPSLQIRTHADRRTSAQDAPVRRRVPVRLQQGAGVAAGESQGWREVYWLCADGEAPHGMAQWGRYAVAEGWPGTHAAMRPEGD